MSELEIDFCGMKLEGPLMNGAGSCKTLEEVELLSRSAVAAIMVGSATVKEKHGNEGDIFYYDQEDELGSINSIGLKNPGLEYYQTHLPKMIELAHAAGKRLFFSGAGHEINEWVELARLAQQTNVDLFEANFSCPNEGRWEIGVPGRLICFDQGSFWKYMEAIKRYYYGPVSVKVSPYSDWFELMEAARTVKELSVEAVTVCNTFPAAFMFRYGTDRPAVVPHFKGLGGYAGSGMRPIALGQVVQWRNALYDPRIGIIGVGGISAGRHIQEFLWNGANCVQITTQLLKKGRLDRSVISPMLSEWIDLQVSPDVH
jgi:dihydroorotate dehydrogenase (fumarate)